MSTNITIDFMELMISKICHDLISPVGAVCNGVEIMQEMGDGGDDEVAGLISFSAKQASAKLQAFRMALGAGGLDGSIKFEQVHQTFENTIIQDGKFTQEWLSDYHTTPEDLPKGFCKMLLSCLLMAIETMPKGGAVKVDVISEKQAMITCKGDVAEAPDAMIETLSMNVNPLNIGPKLVHYFMIALLAEHYGYDLNITNLPDNEVQIMLVHTLQSQN